MVTRIRQILEYKHLTPTQFADLIGVGRPVVSHILSERNKPSLEVAQRIASAFQDISLSWLMFGTGEMLADENGTPLPAPAVAIEPLPKLISELPPTSSPPLAEAISSTTAVPEAEDRVLSPAEATPAAASVLPPTALPRPFATSQPSPAAPPAITPTLAPAPVALPNPAILPEVAPGAVPPTPQPFRAARFIPAPQATPASAPEALVRPAAPVASPVPAAALPASPLVPVAPTSPAGAGAEAAMLPFLAESGKAIKRIVIFYRDGSFADYQPE